jgi:carboxyl-terminal processing protease
MRRRCRNPAPFLAVLIPLTLVLGIWLGGHPDRLPGVARDTLVADSDGRLYEEAVDTIERDYYRRIDRKDLLDKSLSAAVGSLHDQFSNYFSPSAYTGFQESTDGEFEGVGMTVSATRKGLRVEHVYDRSPAKDGGLKPGDLIVRVDGRPLAGKSSAEATALIKGKAGTSVTLSVDDGDRVRDVALRRAKVDVPVVESKLRKQGSHAIAWVHLASFTSGAHGEVGGAVRKLISQGAQGVVLDLRDNGGGLLDEAVQIASIFVPDGKIASTKGRARQEHVYNATGGAISGRIPVAVLVNERSASASEIVTGALQDRRRATVVGTRTYGKGVFQEIERLSNGGALDITVGEYFTPSGRNLGGGGVRKGAGVAPDVQASDDPKTARDEALDTALETVAKKL